MTHYLSHLPTVQNDDGFLISKLLVELLPRLLHIPSLELMDGMLLHSQILSISLAET